MIDTLHRFWRRHSFSIASSPIWLLAFVVISMIACRLYIAAPDDNWGAIGIVDADRVLHGQPLYQNHVSGRPAWMYGPALIWLWAAIFAVTGPSVLLVKLLSLTATAITIALAFAAVRERLPRSWIPLAATSFVLIDGKLMMFATTKPDPFALLFGAAGVLICYRGGLARALLGGLLIAVGMLFKQTAFAFAFIPLFSLILAARWPSPKALLIAVAPALPACAVFIALKSFFPLAWFYMVVLPGQYSGEIAYRDFVILFLQILAGATAIWVLVFVIASRRIALADEDERRLRWAASGLLVTLAYGALACSKFGGGINSLMPAWFALVIAVWLLAGIAAGELEQADNRSLLIPIVVFAIGATLVPNKNFLDPIDQIKAGARPAYLETLARTRALQGSVLAPGDPSITLLTRGQHDRSIYLDIDVAHWPAEMPPELLDRAYSADNIVTTMQDDVEHLRLMRRGYHPIWSKWRYSIWTRTPTSLSPKAS